MLETRTQGTDAAPQELKRFVYSNHLGSASLELDETGAIISYEEYHPYGTTSYQANITNALAKRYRFTGKERDDESGFYYHGARYYIPWLAKWSAVDPEESNNAPKSPYNYCSNNPVMRVDEDGRQDGEKKTEQPQDKKQQLPSFPTDAKEGDFYVTGNDMGALTPSGEMISGTDGKTIGAEKNSQFLYRKGNDGNWFTVGFETKGGEQFLWDSDKKWFVDKKGNEFSDWVSMGVTNSVLKLVTPVVNFIADKAEGKDPFENLKNEWKKYDGSLAGFVTNKTIEGVSSWVDDVKSGGHKRTQAILSLWTNSLSSGPSFDLGSSLFYNATFRGVAKTGRILGGASKEINHYTALAVEEGFSTAITGIHEKAGFFVQISHNAARLAKGRGFSLLYSNSPASIAGRAMQNSALGLSAKLFAFGSFNTGLQLSFSNFNKPKNNTSNATGR